MTYLILAEIKTRRKLAEDDLHETGGVRSGTLVKMIDDISILIDEVERLNNEIIELNESADAAMVESHIQHIFERG